MLLYYSEFSRVKGRSTLLLAQLMSVYKGFICRAKFQELKDKLERIADVRGLVNKLEHLYQPDTDMEDQICEDFGDSKDCIIMDLMEMLNSILLLAIQITKLEKE